MPWLENENAKFQLSRATGMEEMESMDDTTFKESLRAAYRLDNTIGSLVAQEGGLPDREKTTDFNAWEALSEDEKIDDQFTSIAAFADNEYELEAVRRQFTRERQDRETLAKGGLLPSLVAGIADPVNLIPVGGVAYKTYRAGAPILSGAAATASAGAIGAGFAEAGLHYTQLTRTYGESAAVGVPAWRPGG